MTIANQKESAMKPDKIKKMSQKVANVMIVGLVVLGTSAFMFGNQMTNGAEGMSMLFLVFFGAIITVQIIPGLLLMGTMIKGACNLGRKQETAAETATNSSQHK
jgi:hypothetical protein